MCITASCAFWSISAFSLEIYLLSHRVFTFVVGKKSYQHQYSWCFSSVVWHLRLWPKSEGSQVPEEPSSFVWEIIWCTGWLHLALHSLLGRPPKDLWKALPEVPFRDLRTPSGHNQKALQVASGRSFKGFPHLQKSYLWEVQEWIPHAYQGPTVYRIKYTQQYIQPPYASSSSFLFFLFLPWANWFSCSLN